MPPIAPLPTMLVEIRDAAVGDRLLALVVPVGAT